MAPEQQPGETQVSRIYEQPPDAISCYAEVAQIMGTAHEVILPFYETIPGSPGPGGQIQMVRSRLRATVIVSKAHAVNIGRLLLQRGESEKKGDGR